jgi:hypothetical protein
MKEQASRALHGAFAGKLYCTVQAIRTEYGVVLLVQNLQYSTDELLVQLSSSTGF